MARPSVPTAPLATLSGHSPATTQHAPGISPPSGHAGSEHRTKARSAMGFTERLAPGLPEFLHCLCEVGTALLVVGQHPPHFPAGH